MIYRNLFIRLNNTFDYQGIECAGIIAKQNVFTGKLVYTFAIPVDRVANLSPLIPQIPLSMSVNLDIQTANATKEDLL